MLQNKTDLSVLEKEDKLNFQYHNYYTRVSFEKSVENLMINTQNILTKVSMYIITVFLLIYQGIG